MGYYVKKKKYFVSSPASKGKAAGSKFRVVGEKLSLLSSELKWLIALHHYDPRQQPPSN